jgi:hypothetical protein
LGRDLSVLEFDYCIMDKGWKVAVVEVRVVVLVLFLKVLKMVVVDRG